jgi:hypothetical protein
MMLTSFLNSHQTKATDSYALCNVIFSSLLFYAARKYGFTCYRIQTIEQPPVTFATATSPASLIEPTKNISCNEGAVLPKHLIIGLFSYHYIYITLSVMHCNIHIAASGFKHTGHYTNRLLL